MVLHRNLFVLLLVWVVCVHSGSISTDSWVSMATPSNPPSTRDSHTAVINCINNTMVLFGGRNGATMYNNVSLYLLETDTWAVASPAGMPPQRRYGHSAVVSAQNLMVIFGGKNQTNYFNDIATYDLVANKWVQKVVSGDAPRARIGHTAVVDTALNQMVIFGGVDSTGVFLNDVNFFDLTKFTWLPKSNGTTAARAYHSAVVSPLNVMVVFGGSTSVATLADTACYSLTSRSWFSCTKSASPGARAGHSAVTSAIHKMTVFGGRDSTNEPLAEVWNFDLFTYTWQKITPTGVPMNPRYAHSAVSTPFGTMLVFGGISADGTASNEFAKYNLVNAVLRNANDGAVLVVLITLVGTLLISMCFALDYMQEQRAFEKEEAFEQAQTQLAKLLPKIPLGPKAQRFLEDFKVSLDPLKEPSK